MSCTRPIHGYYARSKNENGKRQVVFNPRDGGDPVTLPCGKCPGCRSHQSHEWAIRSVHESRLHEKNSFLTLTYDDQHLPDSQAENKQNFKDFVKRLRARGLSVRYVACGERGDSFGRLHCHAIFFGQDFREKALQLPSNLYTDRNVLDCWGAGSVAIAPATSAAIFYVCGYVYKKMGQPDTWFLQSRYPKIGENYEQQIHAEVLRRDGMVHIDGHDFPIPKRYIQWAEKNDPEFAQKIKARRKNYALKNAAQIRPTNWQTSQELSKLTRIKK